MRLRAIAFVMLAFITSPGTAAPQIGGYTNMTRDMGHGTQIEYLSPAGGAWLWYPGNSVIVPGKWKRSGADICFAYPEDSYNPVTGQQGGAWECMEYRLWWWSIGERVKGDPLRLEGATKVPFKLGRRGVSLDAVIKRVTGDSPPVEITSLTPGDEVVVSCESILANAERSKQDMIEAARIYFYGTFRGQPCVKVDYGRTFELRRLAGVSAEPYLRILRERAATGNPKAIAALKKYGP